LKDILGLFQWHSHLKDKLENDPAKYTLNDVLLYMTAAQDASEAAATGTGIQKRARKLFRGVGKISEVVSPAFQMLPDDLCVLHGGLAVLFNVCCIPFWRVFEYLLTVQIARHRSKSRLRILQAFGDIPNIIAMAEERQADFPDHPALMESVEELKDMLFEGRS
jgi:hypothetical protein